MTSSLLSRLSIAGRVVLCLAVGVLVVSGIAFATRGRWMPPLKARIVAWAKEGAEEEKGHGHAHEDAIKVSEQGLKTIGFEPWTVAIEPEFYRSVTIPAMITERPGRSQIQITAPLTGMVTAIHPIEGAAVEPQSPLFEIRLTHEEVVVAQREVLRTAENLDVVNREIARLKKANVGGENAIAGKRIIEQEYEKQKLEASLKAERQALLLHGLSESQVDEILDKRRLLPSLTIHAPDHKHDGEACQQDHLFHVQSLPVKQGEHVQVGQTLCVLADHCELYVQGRAFEHDAKGLRAAIRNNWDITVVTLADESNSGEAKANAPKDGKLKAKLLYLSDRVDIESRAFLFYLRLPNEVVLSRKTKEGRQFIDWRFKPGQRVELRVPIERWQERIVLPINAVVDEGVESYVYVQNGDEFRRKPVHVEYRDQEWAVVANDGSLFRDDVIAAKGAYQLHLALKNQAGGGIDPHAGHSH
jgi:multidrug efflux pump subunit AcrA (membrane-fusion protein)